MMIIGCKARINCDALRILLADIHYIDNSSYANEQIAVRNSNSGTLAGIFAQSVYVNCVKYVIIVHVGFPNLTPVLCNF